MTLASIWNWLTTSRAYRLLETQNQQLIDQCSQLRAENQRLMLAFSPSLRAAMTDEQPQTAPVESPSQPFRSRARWRTAKRQLESLHNGKQTRQLNTIETNDRILSTQ